MPTITQLPSALQPLTAFPNWIVWKAPDKSPICVRGGDAKSNDPSTWSTYEEARSRCERDSTLGLGFVLTPASGLACVDFDTYKVSDPAVQAEHGHIIEYLNSYTERSPNGGTHVWVWASLVEGHRCKWQEKQIEVYNSGRYMTITGHHTYGTAIENRQSHIDGLLAQFPQQEPSNSAMHSDAPPCEADTVVAGKVMQAYPHLWECLPHEMELKRSERDLQLIKEIARLSHNWEQTFKVFMGSIRANTIRPHRSGQDRNKCINRPEYVKDTVNKAFAEINWHAEFLIHDPSWQAKLKAKFVAIHKPQVEHVGLPSSAVFSKELVTKDIFDIPIEATEFLWDQWIPRGTLVTLGGRGGSFKSTMAYSFAAILQSGLNWPDKTKCETPMNVLVWSNEDSKNCTIPSRCIAAGAKRGQKRIEVIYGTQIADQERRAFAPGVDLPLLKEKAKQMGGVGLIIIDPMMMVVKENNNSASEVTAALGQFLNLAEELNCTIVGIVHYNKSKLYERAIDRLNGSAAWGNVPRMNLMIAKDKNVNQGVVTRAKTNLAESGGGYGFTVEKNDKKDSKGRPYQVIHIVWDDSFIAGGPEEVLASVEEQGDEKRQSTKPMSSAATAFIKAELAKGPKRRSDLIRNSLANDGPSEKTLERVAFKEMEVISRDWTDENGFVHTYWGFPWQFNSVAVQQASRQ